MEDTINITNYVLIFISEFIKNTINFLDGKGIFNNIISWLITLIIAFITSVIYYKSLIKKATTGSIFQTCIYSNHEYITCPENTYLVKDIPEIMFEYRKKLYSTNEKEELFFWNTRISTYVAFTDGNRILVLDRHKNGENQLIRNEGLDCYGAVKFHNPLGSLLHKLPEEFMEINILKFETIPGIALEQNAKKILGLHASFNKEIAIMLGFIVYLKPSDLHIGVDEKKKNKIIDLNCLSPDDENLTAKTRLAIKHLLRVKDR